MLDNKKTTPILAIVGAVALMAMSAPAFAQNAPAGGAAAPAAAAPAGDTAAAPDLSQGNPGAGGAPTSIKHAGKLTPVQMFIDATPVVKTVDRKSVV